MSTPKLEDHYAEVNGLRLHYVSAGNGPLMLFLHGFPEFWYAWKEQLAEFSRDHQAVAPDLRGYNLSDKPRNVDQYEPKHLIADIHALAEHLGARKFVLVAHDWGGVLAWSYAMAYPETLEKLIIINAPHPGVFGRLLATDPAQQAASQYMLQFRSPMAEQMLSANNYAALVHVVMADLLVKGLFTEADKAKYIEAWSQPGALTAGLNYYRASKLGPPAPGEPVVPYKPVDPAMLRVNVPTLVIWGEKDTALLTSNLEGLEAFVPHLTMERIPKGTHWVIHEYPAEVNRNIREFLGN